MSECKTGKKPYVKPMMVFEDFNTGELRGSPEMIEQIKKECRELEAQSPMTSCPFEPFPCFMRGMAGEGR